MAEFPRGAGLGRGAGTYPVGSEGGGTATLSAQVGHVADSVEGPAGHDPSGILVSAVDTAEGFLAAVNGGAGYGPAFGVSWSWPLEGLLGEAFGDLGAIDFGKVGVSVSFLSEVLTNWSRYATPSKGVHWIGVANGPIGAATGGFALGSQNEAASRNKLVGWALSGGTWGSPIAAASNANHTGMRGTTGMSSGSTAHQFIGLSAFPEVDFTGGSLTAFHRWLSQSITYVLDGTPHLIGGVGHTSADVADAIELRVRAAAVRTKDFGALA